jgi:hypothetical protein
MILHGGYRCFLDLAINRVMPKAISRKMTRKNINMERYLAWGKKSPQV